MDGLLARDASFWQDFPASRLKTELKTGQETELKTGLKMVDWTASLFATQVFGRISLRRETETDDWTASLFATQVFEQIFLRRGLKTELKTGQKTE